MAILHFEGFRDLGMYRYNVTRNTTSTTQLNGANYPDTQVTRPLTLSGVSVTTGRTATTFAALTNNAAVTVGNPVFQISLPTLPPIVSSGVGYKWGNNSYINAPLVGIGDVFLYLQSTTQIGIYRRTGPTTNVTLAIQTFSIPTVVINTWNFYELKVDLTNAKIQARINETTIIDYDIPDTSIYTEGNYQCSLFPYGSLHQGLALKYLADWHVASGDFLGDCRVECLPPSGDVSKQWTPNSGVTNYTQVDEASASLTDYVASSTPGAKDVYSHSSVLGDNIANIQAVRVCGVAMGGNDFTQTRKARLNLISNGSTVNGDFKKINTQTGNSLAVIAETNPNTGTAWTKTTVEAVQFGIELGSTT